MAMNLTIDLPPELESRLHAEAVSAGLALNEYLLRLIESRLRLGTGDDSTLALLAAWDREDATDDPKELEARRQDWEDFKRGLNAAHSSARTIYP